MMHKSFLPRWIFTISFIGLMACEADPSDVRDAAADAGVFSKDIKVPSVECKRAKSDREFVSSVAQTLYGRDANSSDLRDVDSPGFNREEFVDRALADDNSTVGIERFLSGLLGLHRIVVDTELNDEEQVQDARLVADLVKEPSILVLRNREKPWAWFFTTRDVYCTEATGDIYGQRIFDSLSFVPCELPEDRAGFLGLASFLRANPSNFIESNNNYKRSKLALYLAQGILLNEATNGPEGDADSGPGVAYPDCAPATDMRIDPDGQEFGSAIIPLQGPVCASCHSTHNGPMSVAFRRFDEKGHTYSFERIDSLNNNARNGASADFLKQLVNENDSCWSFDGVSPPRSFSGLPGLGRLIAESETLGHALGFQIPRHLGNMTPDDNMKASIAKSYYDTDQTLDAAVRGFLLSESFGCAQKASQ